MRNRRLLDIGGIVAGACLLSVGIALIVSALDERSSDGLTLPSRSLIASLDLRPEAVAALRPAALRDVTPPRFRTVDVEGETVTEQLPPVTSHDTSGSERATIAPRRVVRLEKSESAGSSPYGLVLGIAFVVAGVAFVVAGAVDGFRAAR